MGKRRRQPGHEDRHAGQLFHGRLNGGRQIGQGSPLAVHIDHLGGKVTVGLALVRDGAVLERLRGQLRSRHVVAGDDGTRGPPA